MTWIWLDYEKGKKNRQWLEYEWLNLWLQFDYFEADYPALLNGTIKAVKFNLVEFLAIHRAIPIGKLRYRGRPKTTNANSKKASSSEFEVSTSDCEKNREGFQEKF